MNTVFDCADQAGRTAGMAAATSALRAGDLVVMPTDTVYGLGCDAFDGDGVAKLLRTKGRGRDMPVPVLVGSWSTIDGLVLGVSAQVRNLVRAFWPGGLSLVVQQAPSLQWDLGDAHGTVMLRMPLHPVAIELLRAVGPLAVSSANVSGRPPSTNVQEARSQLGAAVDVYLDGGLCEKGVPSTIVDVSRRSPRILREGAVSAHAVSEVTGVSVEQLLA